MRGVWILAALAAAAAGGAMRAASVAAVPLAKSRVDELARLPLAPLHAHTRRIAVVRVPGTPGLRAVQRYIVAALEGLGVFNVTVDSFNASTPLGVRDFHNIVASYNPDAKSSLVFAAHYDSKYFPEPNEFVAATDSAVPCAMLLDLASTFATASRLEQAKHGLKFVFFDGEEAFEQWTSTDSIYGARHLAERWEHEGLIDNIQMLTLLDLIGTPNPQFLNWFPQSTGQQFRELGFLLRQLKSAKLLHDNDITKTYFAENRYYGGVEDDHLPFKNRGVPILHLITLPFPPAWHTPGDNLDSLDRPTTEDLMVLFRCFMSSLLNLTEGVPKQEL